VAVVHIETGPNGLKATMDSPDEGAGGGVRAPSTRIDGAFLAVEWEQLDAVFKGRMSNDRTRIDGLFTQSGGDRSLTLKPVKDAAELVRKRPQTPVKPYPYPRGTDSLLEFTGPDSARRDADDPSGQGAVSGCDLDRWFGPSRS
jgi:hypothetical protein